MLLKISRTSPRVLRAIDADGDDNRSELAALKLEGPVGDEIEPEDGDGPPPPVPGTVRLMTSQPVAMPMSAVGGQNSLREQLEERPWLLAVGALGLLGFFLALRTRRSV